MKLILLQLLVLAMVMFVTAMTKDIERSAENEEYVEDQRMVSPIDEEVESRGGMTVGELREQCVERCVQGCTDKHEKGAPEWRDCYSDCIKKCSRRNVVQLTFYKNLYTILLNKNRLI